MNKLWATVDFLLAGINVAGGVTASSKPIEAFNFGVAVLCFGCGLVFAIQGAIEDLERK